VRNILKIQENQGRNSPETVPEKSLVPTYAPGLPHLLVELLNLDLVVEGLALPLPRRLDDLVRLLAHVRQFHDRRRQLLNADPHLHDIGCDHPYGQISVSRERLFKDTVHTRAIFFASGFSCVHIIMKPRKRNCEKKFEKNAKLSMPTVYIHRQLTDFKTLPA
jgi:hypothetical protein